MTYNISEILSLFTLFSFLFAGIIAKYNPDKLNVLIQLWNFICENNPTLLDYGYINKPQKEEKEKEKAVVIKEENIKQLEDKYVNTYHQKYDKKFSTFPNEYCLSNEEKEKIVSLSKSMKINLIEKYNQELKELTNNLNNIQKIIGSGGLETNEGITLLLEYFKLTEEYEDDSDDIELDECWTDLLIDKGTYEIELTKLNEMTETYNKSDEDIEKEAYELVVKEHLKKYINNYILETTPLGNIYMRYNLENSSFEYFSDYTIPYRYLESAAKRYVMTFWCKPLYIDLEEELKKEYNLQIPAIKPTKETLEIMNKVQTKKGTNTSISNSQIKTKQKSDKQQLKENANRYTWEGRLHDFCPLKKISRKVVDKRLNLTFSDFKRMQQQNKK